MTIARKCIDTLESLDRYWAVKINLRYIFRPLYQDSGFIARILGFIFRTIRISLALVIYAVLIIVSLALYLIWALIPIYIVLHALNQGAYPFPVWLKK